MKGIVCHHYHQKVSGTMEKVLEPKGHVDMEFIAIMHYKMIHWIQSY